MGSTEFTRRSDACLARAARWLESFDPDELDFATSDGVVTLEFADKQRFVLNRQSATNQMWLAAGARAWHYDFDEATQSWLDDRDRSELFARIAAVVSTKLGRTASP